jgi:hypothetical protein
VRSQSQLAEIDLQAAVELDEGLFHGIHSVLGPRGEETARHPRQGTTSGVLADLTIGHTIAISIGAS